jgi:hypothetical protein
MNVWLSQYNQLTPTSSPYKGITLRPSYRASKAHMFCQGTFNQNVVAVQRSPSTHMIRLEHLIISEPAVPAWD